MMLTNVVNSTTMIVTVTIVALTASKEMPEYVNFMHQRDNIDQKTTLKCKHRTFQGYP